MKLDEKKVTEFIVALEGLIDDMEYRRRPFGKGSEHMYSVRARVRAALHDLFREEI